MVLPSTRRGGRDGHNRLGELERLVTQTLLDVIKRIANEELKNEKMASLGRPTQWAQL
jgi:hypothetical protein